MGTRSAAHPARDDPRGAGGSTAGQVGRSLIRTVSVIGVNTTSGPKGMTCSSLTIVSFEPSLIMLVVRPTGSIRSRLVDAGAFGVSILLPEQEWVARLLASRTKSRDLNGLVGHTLLAGPMTGSPLVKPAFGWMDCRIRTIQAVGDHVTVIGDVLHEVLHRAAGLVPLVHGSGRYHRLAGFRGRSPVKPPPSAIQSSPARPAGAPVSEGPTDDGNPP